MNNGGEKRWNVTVIQDLFPDGQKLQTKEETTLHSVGQYYLLKPKYFDHPIAKRQEQVSSLQLKSPRIYMFIGNALNAVAAGQETYSWQMQKNGRTTLLQKSTSKDSKEKK